MPPEDNIIFLVGAEKNIASQINATVPFDDTVIDFLSALSSELIGASAYSDVISFAFYCRKANILKQKELFAGGDFRLGKGFVFHIAPGNVPVNFAFSFVFSLLAGNLKNVVRVPSKDFEQVNIICSALNKILQNDKYRQIKQGTAIIKYPHENNITKTLSAACDMRIIWGGDDTVNSIRMNQLKPSATDIAFFDRVSISLIGADEVNNADCGKLKKLASNFYNDTFLMDQNACSSPYLVLWTGKDIDKAKARFWNEVQALTEIKYELQPVSSVDKLISAYNCAMELNNIKIKKQDNICYRIEISELIPDLEKLKGNCGFFFEKTINSLDEIMPIITKKYQTLTYYGISEAEIKIFVEKNKPGGIDRIVPIGQALNIGLIWDGYNLIDTFSRIVFIT